MSSTRRLRRSGPVRLVSGPAPRPATRPRPVASLAHYARNRKIEVSAGTAAQPAGAVDTRAVTGTVIITGGSRGIGAATAVLAARHGWSVCLSYRADAPRPTTSSAGAGPLASRPSRCAPTSPTRRTSSACSTPPRPSSVRCAGWSTTPAWSRRSRRSPTGRRPRAADVRGQRGRGVARARARRCAGCEAGGPAARSSTCPRAPPSSARRASTWTTPRPRPRWTR